MKLAPRTRKPRLELLEGRVLLSSATAVAVAELEPNDAQSQATAISPPAVVSGVLDAPGDVDFFALDVAAEGLLSVGVAPRDGASLDSRLALHNSPSFVLVNGLRAGGGGLLGSSDDRAADDRNPFLSRFLLPGHYFVAVSGGEPTAVGAYTLSLEFGPGVNHFPKNADAAPGQPVGDEAVALLTADFNRDGILDLATANHGSSDVSILVGIGDNGFEPQPRLALADPPTDLAAVDLNDDGRLDLVTLGDAGFVSVLRGVGDGSFQTHDIERFAAEDPAVASLFTKPPALQARGDFNRDGSQDLARLVADPVDDEAPFRSMVELGSALPPEIQLKAEVPFNPLVVRDWPALLMYLHNPSNDGKPLSPLLIEDLTAFLQSLGERHIIEDVPAFLKLLGVPEVFLGSGRTASDPSRERPLMGDLDGDGTADLVVLNSSGDILFRPGRPGQPGVFEAPVLVNAATDDPSAVTVTLVRAGGRISIAALDLRSSTGLTGTGFRKNTLSLYVPQSDGRFRRFDGPTTGVQPTSISAADLDGDGLDDLVVAGATFDTLTLYLGQPDGSFLSGQRVAAAIEPSAVVLADVNGDGRLDALLTNQVSGDVSVLVNLGLPPGQVGFGPELRLRGGTADAGVFESNASDLANSLFPGFFPQLYYPISSDETHTVAVGDFTSDGVPDLVVTNRGADNFALLRGKGGGSFVDPHIIKAGRRPTAVQAAYLDGDGRLDLAILNEGDATISVFLGDGAGGFQERLTVDNAGNRVPLLAGHQPTGFSAHDVNGDGLTDLLLGNQAGDALTLLGNGNGTFQAFTRVGRNIALAVADMDGDGQDDLVFGNEALDRVFVDYAQAPADFVQGRQDGLLAPGAVSADDLNRDGLMDLVVANKGGNSVLVYLGSGGGQFEPRREFFAGTSPASVTVADVDADNVPDLVVANEGSNDVSVLRGEGTGSGWTLRPGPRLDVGRGPVSTTVMDVTGDDIPDIVVSNSQSNDVYLLPGVGAGFFNDRAPAIFLAGVTPRQTLAGNFDGTPGLDLVTLNAGSNNLTLFANFAGAAVAGRTFASGGSGPLTGLANDFNRDGITDLIVANNGDGMVSLFLGSPDGPTQTRSLFSPDMLHPTALALAAFGGDSVQVHIAGEGQERTTLLSFNLDTGLGVPVPIDLGGGSPVGGQGPTTVLLPLRESTFALVATLLPGSPEADVGGERPARGDANAPDDPGLEDAALGGDAPADVEAQPGATPGSEAEIALTNFLFGLDAARDRAPPLESDALFAPAARALLGGKDAALYRDFRDRGLALGRALREDAEALAEVGLAVSRNLLEGAASRDVKSPEALVHEVIDALFKAAKGTVAELERPFSLPSRDPQGRIAPSSPGSANGSAVKAHDLTHFDGFQSLMSCWRADSTSGLGAALFAAGLLGSCWSARLAGHGRPDAVTSPLAARKLWPWCRGRVAPF